MLEAGCEETCLIPRKRRKQFETFLTHEDPRVREMAEEMLEEDSEMRGMLLQQQPAESWYAKRLSLLENFDDRLEPTEEELSVPPQQNPEDDEVPF